MTFMLAKCSCFLRAADRHMHSTGRRAQLLEEWSEKGYGCQMTAVFANSRRSSRACFGPAGFAWLVVPKNHTLAIETTPNQDNTLMTGIQYPGDIPILGIDVWEHGECHHLPAFLQPSYAL